MFFCCSRGFVSDSLLVVFWKKILIPPSIPSHVSVNAFVIYLHQTFEGARDESGPFCFFSFCRSIVPFAATLKNQELFLVGGLNPFEKY